MVVVILIGILAVTAIPSMSNARFDRRTYDDASQVAELFRTARTRAIGRGASMLIAMNPPGTVGTRGRFELWEAQVTAGAPVGLGLVGTPMTSCSAPTVWYAPGTPTKYFVDAVDMNGNFENNVNAGITSSINDPANVNLPGAYTCVTPLGRWYYSAGVTAPVFIPGATMSGALQIVVTRSDTNGKVGISRTVYVPPSGATRIISK
jgi:type II secretory pathway pseudopilin PulG